MNNFPGLYFQTLVIQNYRTFGQKKTIINFDDYFGLTSIRGLNKDQQTADSRNGCGKSSILSALCFAITGKPLKKAKSQGALVNHLNKKGLRVTLDFWFKGQFCRIDRGVSPSFCKFYRRPVGETKEIEEYDESIRAGKGATEDLIQNLLGLDLAMFRLVVVSAAKQDAFFNMDAKDQKPLIENLFNQTRLSQKGARIKQQRELLEIELDKEKVRLEERLKAHQRALENKKAIFDNQAKWVSDQTAKIAQLEVSQAKWIEDQTKKINGIIADKAKWTTDQDKKIASLREQLDALNAIDLDTEIATWATIDELTASRIDVMSSIRLATSNVSQCEANIAAVEGERTKIARWLADADKQDPSAFIAAWDEAQANKDVQARYKTELAPKLQEETKLRAQVASLTKEIAAFDENCPTCGQLWPDHQKMHAAKAQKETELAEVSAAFDAVSTEIMRLNMGISESQPMFPTSAYFSTRDSAVSFDSDKKNKEEQKRDLSVKLAEGNKLLTENRETLAEHQAISREVDTTIESLKADLKTASKMAAEAVVVEYARIGDSIVMAEREINPYDGMIEKAEAETNPYDAMIAASLTEVNPFDKMVEDMDDEAAVAPDTSLIDSFEQTILEMKELEKLMTRKDSPLRAGILREWLPRLNHAVTKYLTKTEFEYGVQFNGDLTVSIFASNGEEKDFGDLSSGEEERLDLALSWAFRDIFEQLHYPINFYAVDERLDSGLCPAGAVKGATVLKEMSLVKNRVIFLITHRQDANELVDKYITVVKEHGFSELTSG